MRKLINYVLVTIIFSFVFTLNTLAECSYQERKGLLNDAKNVDISFEVVEETEELVGFNPNSDEKETFTRTVYKFKLNFVGIKDSFFIRLSNDFNTEEVIINSENSLDGKYSLEIDNSSDIIKYYVAFYSANNNCYADSITTKTVKKPKENSIHYFSICKNDVLEDNEYCKQFVDKDFSISQADIMEKLNNILNQSEKDDVEKENFNIISFIKTYWYYFLAVSIGVVVVTIIIFRRKRSRL